MLERERREDQADRLVILPTAGHSGRGAGRIMKSPREVLIRPIALSLAAILLTTVLVAEAYSHATALHIRDPEDLALAFLLPTIFIALFFWQHARGRKFLRKRTRRCLRCLPATTEHLDS